MDDQSAKDLRNGSEPLMAFPVGNGSCRCNAHFFGKNCSVGQCPTGQEQQPEDTGSKVRSCSACPLGRGKSGPGNDACAKCSPGNLSLQGVCTACPVGKVAGSAGSPA